MVKLRSQAKFIKYIGVPDFSSLYPCRSAVILEQPSTPQNGLPVGVYRIYTSSVLGGRWSDLESTGLVHRPGETLCVDLPALRGIPLWTTGNMVCNVPAHFVHCIPDGYDPQDPVDDALKVQNVHHGRDIYIQFFSKSRVDGHNGGLGGAKYRCMLHGAPGVEAIRIIQSPKVYVGPSVDTYLVLMHFSCFEPQPAAGSASIFVCSPNGQVTGSCDLELSGNRCYAISMKRLIGAVPVQAAYVGTVIAVVHADVVPLIHTLSDDGLLCSTDHSVPPMKYLPSLHRGDVKRETAQNLLAVLSERAAFRHDTQEGR